MIFWALLGITIGIAGAYFGVLWELLWIGVGVVGTYVANALWILVHGA